MAQRRTRNNFFRSAMTTSCEGTRSSQSEGTVSSDVVSPVRLPRPHSVAGRLPSYAMPTVASRIRLSLSTDKLPEYNLPLCCRYRAASPPMMLIKVKHRRSKSVDTSLSSSRSTRTNSGAGATAHSSRGGAKRSHEPTNSSGHHRILGASGIGSNTRAAGDRAFLAAHNQSDFSVPHVPSKSLASQKLPTPRSFDSHVKSVTPVTPTSATPKSAANHNSVNSPSSSALSFGKTLSFDTPTCGANALKIQGSVDKISVTKSSGGSTSSAPLYSGGKSTAATILSDTVPKKSSTTVTKDSLGALVGQKLTASSSSPMIKGSSTSNNNGITTSHDPEIGLTSAAAQTAGKTAATTAVKVTQTLVVAGQVTVSSSKTATSSSALVSKVSQTPAVAYQATVASSKKRATTPTLSVSATAAISKVSSSGSIKTSPTGEHAANTNTVHTYASVDIPNKISKCTSKESSPAVEKPPVKLSPESQSPNKREETKPAAPGVSTVPDAAVDEYRAKLAEKRRLAREKADREAEQQRLKEEETRLAEEERVRREEEEEVRREAEELRQAEEARALEQERFNKLVAEEEKRKQDEAEKMEAEKQERLERERMLKEEAERVEIEKRAKIKREEEEKNERKKRLENVMKRVKSEDTANKSEDSSTKEVGISQSSTSLRTSPAASNVNNMAPNTALPLNGTSNMTSSTALPLNGKNNMTDFSLLQVNGISSSPVVLDDSLYSSGRPLSSNNNLFNMPLESNAAYPVTAQVNSTTYPAVANDVALPVLFSGNSTASTGENLITVDSHDSVCPPLSDMGSLPSSHSSITGSESTTFKSVRLQQMLNKVSSSGAVNGRTDGSPSNDIDDSISISALNNVIGAGDIGKISVSSVVNQDSIAAE